MSDSDWKIGDLALCKKIGPWHQRSGKRLSSDGIAAPRAGGIYRVESFRVHPGYLGLILREFPALVGRRQVKRSWQATAFRKVTPPPADEFDREIIDLMLGKPLEVIHS